MSAAPERSHFDLTGRTAVVTGGTGVLGTTICRELARAGARVAVLATTEEKTRRLADAINATGGQAMGIQANVLERDSLKAAAKEVYSAFDQVDILINGAGGNRPEATTAPASSFFDLPQDALQWVLNLNFMGTLLTTQVFGKGMAERGQGVVLNVSSMAAIQPLTRVVAYGSAKAAVNNFTQWLAVYLAREYNPDIRVNAIAPGFFLTEQNRFLLLDKNTGDLTTRGQQIIDHTPMARFGDPEDLIGTILWLVSDASRFVTGIVVPVDGGFSAFGGV
jgi:NAD(P)-dependent dehydrogenase (short-subunit alcohol dehydrogenase family)